MLNTLLKEAVDWEAIDRMPCAVRLLTVPERSMDFYDADEYVQMVAAAAQVRMDGLS